MGTPRIDSIDRNFLINGNFSYAQRGYNVNVSMLGSPSYQTADRWQVGYNSAWTGTPVSNVQVSTVPPGSFSTQALLLQGTPNAKNADTNLQASQKIESIFSRQLADKTVTLSTWYYAASGAGADATITVEFAYPSAVDNWTSSTVFSTTTFNPTAIGSWQQKLITLTLPPNAASGISVRYKYGNLNTGGARQFYLTDCCLMLGERPSVEFVYAGRNAVEELQLCQRYYEKSYDINTAPGTITQTGSQRTHMVTTSQTNASIRFSVVKRATPLFAVYSTATGVVNVLKNTSGGDAAALLYPAANGNAGIPWIDTSIIVAVDTDMRFHWTADAEL